MNLNNIYAGVLGFIIAMSLIYIFWSPMSTMISGIESTELRIFVNVVWIAFIMIVFVIGPINLSTSDDRGQQ